ncbi:hypothetical protein QM012_005352 [Aureobasidium pullulans]|uniref:Uncharacterized protein n=1 Tax=Aureobasidium pullulans TaxID=5580 RepID=A0ABR0T5K2_AURPU
MSSNTGISPHATRFIHSYATATALGASSSPPDLQACATAMSTHYLPNLISYTLGTSTSVATPSEASKGTLTHLQKLASAGVGTDIRLVRVAVKEISEFAAAVFVTWELVVDDFSIADEEKAKSKGGEDKARKAKGWRWRNCYGYRRMSREVDGEEVVDKEGFEYIVSDEEVGELIKRVPKYFES